jgi:hypothetical protein
MDTHENAANAIVHLQNMIINGSPAKVINNALNFIYQYFIHILLAFLGQRSSSSRLAKLWWIPTTTAAASSSSSTTTSTTTSTTATATRTTAKLE